VSAWKVLISEVDVSGVKATINMGKVQHFCYVTLCTNQLLSTEIQYAWVG